MSNDTATSGMLRHASDLSQSFSGHTLFQNIRINVASGQIIILRGDNGTGKTTLLRILAGLRMPQAGQVRIDSVEIKNDHTRAASKMVFIGHRDGLAAELTAGEAIHLWAQTRGLFPCGGMLELAFSRLGLVTHIGRPVRVLSAGQRRRCSMVRLALINAMDANMMIPLWLLDEPTATMDDTAVGLFADLLAQHAARGGGAMVTSHLDLPLPDAKPVMLAELNTPEAAK